MPPGHGATLNPEKALIFRITHRDNLPFILDNGLHAPGSGVLDPNYRNIGNVDLIGKRTRRVVPCGPGGTLTDYVPFYFTPYSIMLLNIHTGYNVKQVPNDEILILVSSLRTMAELNIPFVFTDQHAYPPMAQYYIDLKDLDKIPWAQLNSRDFNTDPDDPGKKERYQAEALIWQHVPLKALLGICCYNAQVLAWIQEELAKRNLGIHTSIQNSWYF
jgi:hypothetical protein